MSTISSSIRGKSWVAPVTILSVVLGILLAAALKTQQRVRTEDLGVPYRIQNLATALRGQKEVNEGLLKEIASLREQNTKYEKQLAQGTNEAKTLGEQLQTMKFLAGLTPAKGPGVIVNLHDRTEKLPENAPAVVIQDFLAHDSDIRTVTNELRAAGAEFISVNGQRLISTSAIRCVGPVVLVNGIEIAAPFEIKAIGDPETLFSGLKLKGGVADELAGMIDIKMAKEIVIPGYSGSVQFRFAKPVE